MGKVVGLLVMVLVGVLGSSGLVRAKDDFVQHTFRCPGDTFFRTDWVDKISSDPTFTVRSDAEKVRIHPPLVGMTRSGQTITCRYVTGLASADYDYRVDRHIISCTPSFSVGNDKHMRCDLRP